MSPLEINNLICPCRYTTCLPSFSLEFRCNSRRDVRKIMTTHFSFLFSLFVVICWSYIGTSKTLVTFATSLYFKLPACTRYSSREKSAHVSRIRIARLPLLALPKECQCCLRPQRHSTAQHIPASPARLLPLCREYLTVQTRKL